jgi:hypothetical protein
MTKLKNIVIAIGSILVSTTITQAQTTITHEQALIAVHPVSYDEPLAVKYIGNDGEYLTFQVIVQSAIPGNALFTIVDKEKGELFSSKFTPNYKVQTVKIEKTGDQELNFKLVVGKEIYSKSFSVNTNRVESTTVTENDITLL